MNTQLIPRGGVSDRRRHILLALTIPAIAIALVACGPGGVTGTGPTKIDPRNVESYTRVDVSNGIGLTLQVGGAQAVEVVGQENILPLITTTVEGGVLKIRGAGSFTTSAGVIVTATVPTLEGISVAGGSQASIVGVAVDRLEIDVSGGAGLVATGRAMDVTFVSTEGSRADLAALATETMSVEVSGGATAALNVSVELTGSASGGAVATVVGGASVNVQISGGARVSSD